MLHYWEIIQMNLTYYKRPYYTVYVKYGYSQSNTLYWLL